MRHNPIHIYRPTSDQLHPLVYAAVVGLAVWFVLSAWFFFAGGGHRDFLLVAVSGFFFIAILIPYQLWHVWRSDAAGEVAPEGKESLQDWLLADFAIVQERRSSVSAAVEILLAIAAVAFGMTIFGMVLYLTKLGLT